MATQSLSNSGSSGESEKALRRSEEPFRLLVDGVKDYAIFMLDIDGRITTWNQGAKRIKGYEAAEIVGRHFSAFYREEDRQEGRPEKALLIAAAQGSYEAQDLRVRKDGSTFWADIVITALRDDEGHLRGYAKVTRDITARKEAEERERVLVQERAAREQVTAILESISDAFYAVDYEWRFTYINRKAEEIWGRSREELLGKNVWEVFPDAVGSESSRQINRAMRGRVTTEFEAVSPDLGVRIAGQAYPSRAGLSVYFRDVTERKLAEEEIRRSEERYRRFVEQSTEGIWRFELEEPVSTGASEAEQIDHFYRHAYLAECNDVVARMYGYARAEQIVGVRMEDFLPRAIPENVAYLQAFVRSGYQLTDAESEEVDRAGRPRRFLNNLTGIVEDGSLVRAWGMQRDVTEQRQAEEEQRFLVEVSDVLSSSLDYRATLASVARLAVPFMADWCAVDILLEGGSLERLAVEHPDPQKVALAYKLQTRYPSSPDAPRGVHQVLRTGEPDMMSEISEEVIARDARDAEHREILKKLGLRSYIVVPLVARGRTLAAISLVTAESGRRYGDADLRLAQELARRAALAVDNARLYQEAQKEIARREWAQEELRNSKDQLEAILRGVADGITAQDPTGQLVYANDAAARIVGYPTVQEFVEASVEDVMARFQLLDEAGHPMPFERLPGRRALLGEEAEEVLRFHILATDEERWAIVKAMPIFGAEGEIRMAVNIFRDITESKRIEASLTRVRVAERRRLARDLHDSVLQDLSYTAASLGMLLLQAENTKLEVPLQSTIDSVRRSAEVLRYAVNDLRSEDEGQKAFTERVESLVARHRAMARGAHEISLEVEEGVPSAPFGEIGTQIFRILQEALTNARRHSGAKTISVNVRMEDVTLVAQVADDGRGFGADAASGVGQSSMRERAQVIGADLNIDSKPGRGTRVSLRIPLPQVASERQGKRS
jgi:PAS domain S-box-containing protein